MTDIDLVLHPVRLRILQSFLGGRQLTVAQLARELPDIPQSALYRHVGRLAEGGILTVAAERQARGAVERSYTLAAENTRLDPKDIAALSREEHSQLFTTFAATLIAAYNDYLATGAPDLVRDGVSYSMNALWLTDAEHLDLLREIAQVVAPRAANGPASGRRRRLTASAFFPLAGNGEDNA